MLQETPLACLPFSPYGHLIHVTFESTNSFTVTWETCVTKYVDHAMLVQRTINNETTVMQPFKLQQKQYPFQ
jgi:hypothetical protein